MYKLSDNLIVENIYLSVLDEQNANDKEDLVTDVIVTMENKTKYLATFYTYEYLKKKIIKEQNHNRMYWCMAQFTLVDSFDFGRIEKIIEKMIDCGDFQLMFLKLD